MAKIPVGGLTLLVGANAKQTCGRAERNINHGHGEDRSHDAEPRFVGRCHTGELYARESMHATESALKEFSKFHESAGFSPCHFTTSSRFLR